MKLAKKVLSYLRSIQFFVTCLIFQRRFYIHFFKVNPAAERLFDVKYMNVQSKAFSRMLIWIIENLGNKNLIAVLSQLGGRHVIYGTQSRSSNFVTLNRGGSIRI